MRTLLALLVACGHPAAPVPPPVPVDRDSTAPPAAADPARPSARECDALFAHVAALAAADQRAALPSLPASDADISASQGMLRTREMAGCRALARTTYACAIAAPSSAQLIACDP